MQVGCRDIACYNETVMDINLTAIGQKLTAPVRWISSKFNRGRSRYQRVTPVESKMRNIKLIRLAGIVSLVGALVVIVGFFVAFAWFSRDLPKPGEVVRREGFSTRIFDRNGELLFDLYDTERRVPITIDQAPADLKNATIAIEDKDFYKHGGFDFLTVFRIPYYFLTRQQLVGGSTLTQQLVKNALLTNERSLPRKFKEFVLAIQIERKFSKDQILEMYLNENPYGGTAWGVGTAAEVYFNKPVSELNLVESAILAGLPQRPSAYSPFSGKTDETGQPLWQLRARGVLRRMQEDDHITEAAYQQALGDLELITFQQNATGIKAPHFVFYVRDQLVELYGEEIAEKGGLKVTTSLDSSLQDEAQTIVAEEIAKVEAVNITNGSAMVMNPKNGEILAMVGSKDYFSKEIDGQFNVAVDGLRQPGSSIKPLTYLAMFQKGFTPASMLMDVETTFTSGATTEEPYKPRNYDGIFRGPVSIRNSLGSSLNVPAVKSMGIVGIENFLNLAYNMGFLTLEPSAENLKRFGLSLTLGGGEVHLIDTVTAYSAFANGGSKVEPVSILRVEDKDGNLLFENRPTQGQQVIRPEEAFLINDILSDNSARLIAFGGNSLLNTRQAIAVKTGTTNEQKDNWTIGWSQELMVGVWVGNNNNSSMTRVASGITGASPIWRRIIDTALTKGYSAPAWQVPEGVEQVEVDVVSGYPSHDGYPSRKEYAIKGTVPSLPDPVHAKLKVCRGEEKLANDARIASGDYDEKEYFVLKESDPMSKDGINRWQEAITAWMNGQSDSRYKPPTEYCGDQNEVFIRLHRPENEKIYQETKIEIDVQADAGDGIEKIEVWVDGGLRETVNAHTYKGTLDLSPGKHEIYAKAKSRSGKEATSGTARIGTGGQDWKSADPSPSPTPSPSPSPTGLILP